jgi:hypothetical protein
MITRITLYIWGKRKCEKNARIHTRIYESPNLILGGIIIKEKGKKRKEKIYIRKEGKEEVKEKKRKEKKRK